MSDRLVLEETIGEDGKLVLQLPPGRHVRITVEMMPEQNGHELTPEEEAALDAELEELLSDESLNGLGLTAEEIAKSPEIGMWKDRTDIVDSVRFVEEMRRKRRERRMRRDE